MRGKKAKFLKNAVINTFKARANQGIKIDWTRWRLVYRRSKKWWKKLSPKEKGYWTNRMNQRNAGLGSQS